MSFTRREWLAAAGATLVASRAYGAGRPVRLGGPIFLGGWMESGSAFDDLDAAQLKTNISVGTIAETLVGPVLLGGSFDFGGAWRYYIGIGRLF